jgi:hypothetical protein
LLPELLLRPLERLLRLPEQQQQLEPPRLRLEPPRLRLERQKQLPEQSLLLHHFVQPNFLQLLH